MPDAIDDALALAEQIAADPTPLLISSASPRPVPLPEWQKHLYGSVERVIDHEAPSLMAHPRERQMLLARLTAGMAKAEEEIVKSAKPRGACFSYQHAGQVVTRPGARYLTILTEKCAHGNPEAVLLVKDWFWPWGPENYLESMGWQGLLAVRWMANLTKNYMPLVEFCEWLETRKQKSSLIDLYEKARGGTGPHEGKPAFIVGSGPSLEKNGHHLANLDPANGIVIAVNGAMKTLPRFDYFCTVDWLGAPWWWTGQEEKIKQATAILNWGCAPELTKLPWGGVRFYAQMGNTPPDLWMRSVFPFLDDLDRGYTSTFTAFHLAVMMGCNPIVFVGCDYAYGTQERNHAGVDDKIPEKMHLLCEEDINGREIVTSAQMKVFCEHIKAASRFCAEAGCKIINASEEGILSSVDGSIECVPLEMVVDLINSGVVDNGRRTDRTDVSRELQLAGRHEGAGGAAEVGTPCGDGPEDSGGREVPSPGGNGVCPPVPSGV